MRERGHTDSKRWERWILNFVRLRFSVKQGSGHVLTSRTALWGGPVRHSGEISGNLETAKPSSKLTNNRLRTVVHGGGHNSGQLPCHVCSIPNERRGHAA